MATNSRCAACKYLRKRCSSNCVFSPYFPSSYPQKFEYVHKIYGASNIARMLQRIPLIFRGPAAETLCLEAYWRVKDPVYGCVGIIDQLQNELQAAQNELVLAQTQLALISNRIGPSGPFIPHDSIIGPSLQGPTSFGQEPGSL